MALSDSGSVRQSVMALIPAYREERFIRDVAERTARQVEAVLVVDDGSVDNTRSEAEASGVEVIVHTMNQGKGAAIKTGLRRFLQTDFTYLVILDGDGQHLPEEIDHFSSSIADSDTARLFIGNRMADTTVMPWVRRMVNRFMSGRISSICGQRIPDTQCGFRMVHRDLVPLLLSESNAFDYESEMLFEVALAGYPIVSIPVSTLYGEETSKIRPIQDTIKFFQLLNRYRGRSVSKECD